MQCHAISEYLVCLLNDSYFTDACMELLGEPLPIYILPPLVATLAPAKGLNPFSRESDRYSLVYLEVLECSSLKEGLLYGTNSQQLLIIL